MASLNTKDEPLSNKHKEFNKQVQDAITSRKPLVEKEFVKNGDDLDNLMKIDIASHNKDVDYILSVLKSDDMLYISRVIKQSPWLVDDQYANIINPTFLNENLFPTMKTKASIKLLKHIRHYLKNESRVEEFYMNEKNKKVAAKWLSRCSIPFINENIKKHMMHITNSEFKRLCERSVTVLETAMEYCTRDKLKAASFLLHTHTDKYLDVFEKTNRYDRHSFSASATELVMKKSPDRIINKFLKYVNHIHIPTFIENINRDQIQGFLYRIVDENDKTNHGDYYFPVYTFNTIKLFIQRMPKEEQFGFVKRVFLDQKINVAIVNDETLQRGTEEYIIRKICTNINRRPVPVYHWYEFAPFNIAFAEIKKLIEAESKIEEKYSMYNALLKYAKKNTNDLLDVLMYYSKNSLNDDVNMKKRFIDEIVSVSVIYKSDQETWKVFTDIYNSMNIATDSYSEIYLQAIILHDILNDKQVPAAVKERFLFKCVSLKQYRIHLNQDEQNKVFEYMYNYALKKVQGHNILTKEDFEEAIKYVRRLLNVLLDWDKELADYPFALEKIKDLTQIRKDNSWKTDMSSLYNKKKSWKRLMFEESIVLSPSQNVFVNALKHDPNLLARYQSDVDAICCNDAISLKRLLKKIRIYWPNSLANIWTKSYFDRLDNLEGHKALTRGLCTILSQEPLHDIIKMYAPAEPKIDWNNTNELTLGLQRCFAKNMHIARPQPSADTILLYAKGDFLQYALPSLLAIYYNMGRVESQEHIPKLLNSPVSLQKHGLRLAFIKLKHDELKIHLSNMWQTSKNISIRAVTFVLLFDLMCKEKDVAKAEELWEILEVFIDNLSFKEDKKIYDKLSKVNDVPESIKPKFLIKSYKFLKALVPHVKIDRETYESNIQNLAYYTKTIMEFMCPEFVANLVTEHLDANFCKDSGLSDSMLAVTSSYLLCSKDEETQNNKYEKVLAPFLKRAINQWDEISGDKYFVRRNVQNLLNYVYRDLEEYVVERKMVVPTKMFQNIKKELDSLPVPQNYIILRMWKLIVKMTEIMEKNDKSDDWQQLCTDMVPEFGRFCLEILKEDVKAYFSCIYVLYEKVLSHVLQSASHEITLNIYEVLLSDKEFIQAYLLVLNLLPNFGSCYDENDKRQAKTMEIKQLIFDNSSVEIRMHYYCKYGDDDNSLGI